MTTAEAVRILDSELTLRGVNGRASEALAAIKAALAPKKRKPRAGTMSPAAKAVIAATKGAPVGVAADRFDWAEPSPSPDDFGGPVKPASGNAFGTDRQAEYNAYHDAMGRWKGTDEHAQYEAAVQRHSARAAQFNYESPRKSIKDDELRVHVEAFLSGVGAT